MSYLCPGRDNNFWEVGGRALIFKEQAGDGCGGGGGGDRGDGHGGGTDGHNEGGDVGDNEGDGDTGDDNGVGSARMTSAQTAARCSLSSESHFQLPHCHPLLCLAGPSHSQCPPRNPLPSLAFLSLLYTFLQHTHAAWAQGSGPVTAGDGHEKRALNHLG